MCRGAETYTAKFRRCNLLFAIETGRYTRPKSPISARLCRYCDKDALGVETHFLVEYEFYSDLRYKLFQSAHTLKETFKHSDPSNKHVFLMNCEEQQCQLANVLFKMNKRRFLNA